MRQPRILAQGNFTTENLAATVADSSRKIYPELEQKIEKYWLEKKAAADEAGRVCYNGKCYSINSIVESGPTLSIEFGIVEYKVHDGLLSTPEYSNLPEEYYSWGCYNYVTIKTADDKYVMVELSGKSMNYNAVDLVGGVMDTDIEMINGDSVFESIYKELEEEAMVEKKDIKNCFLKAIFLSDKVKVAFYFEAILNVSTFELSNRFAHNKDPDIKSLIFLLRDDYLNKLATYKSSSKKLIKKLITI